MVFGYTPLDPLIVLIGTAYAGFLLVRDPVRLMAFLPAALCLYFIIPTVTLLTLWQTVPLLLMFWLIAQGKLVLPKSARPFVALLMFLFLVSCVYAIVLGRDPTRAVIRSIYYASTFALFLYAYDIGRRPEAYRLFVVGFAVTAAILSLYGLYQFFASATGLPYRGILRGAYGADSAFENGILRINSLANEPKRLGYVLFVGALAFFERATWLHGKARRNSVLWGVGVLFVSLFTFSGSYFLALALFGVGAFVLYPVRLRKAWIPLLVFSLAFVAFGQNTGLYKALETGIERRQQEVELGTDGYVVYRQEFFAQDYLERHPGTAFTGVGVGQYYNVLHSKYGDGVGLAGGRLLPINAMALELTFDVGGIAAATLFSGLVLLIFRLRRRGFVFLTLALLFLTVQSLTIQTLLYIAVVTGIGLAQLRTRVSEENESNSQSPLGEYGPEPGQTALPANGRSAS
ncbi:hypothetical protein [Tropicimonas isoalkanivorans]|uniref:O-antigen ligase like membrane protein n=1 Tax=Tropicimonas isoalkanivorans TaxID=441112 RepID=A0A1I1DXT8_9RHOB|nr:hypothetical protein [Tropicimonas isoalkanivorans]SFB77818.1 hypothetical protein SAMN04488094_101452 [Tropicimonas isoalkanivorans]